MWVFVGPVLCFFLEVLVVIARKPSMFVKRFARSHRVAGLVYLAWLLLGFFDAAFDIAKGDDTPAGNRVYHWRGCYDAILGILGTVLTLTAANDFKKAHEGVKNPASGALDEHATVTHSEMIEHSFYQMLNIAQILFLHALSHVRPPPARAVLAIFVTAPWLIRHRFPVNKFSDNYKRDRQAAAYTVIGLMYRTKKYQYLFYKHFCLHGLNITLALEHTPELKLTQTAAFRRYWMALNAAYVMEFFLQTLVKKGHMRQSAMLRLNQLLMLVSSISALQVLSLVRIPTALLSLTLNVAHRGHEFVNTLVVLLASLILQLGQV